MAQVILEMLRERDYEPVVAYYEPYTVAPELSAPSYRLFGSRVHARPAPPYFGCEAHALGAWLPELEFTHYLPTRQWRELTASCDYHVAVSGNCLAATPFALMGAPYLCWVATPWAADRKDRVARFPWYRRLLDSVVNRRVLERLERRILSRGSILALSEYTRRALEPLTGGAGLAGIMPQPVDTDAFQPAPGEVMRGHVGFVGRLDDPRKNIELMLRTVAEARRAGLDLTAELIGGPAPARLTSLIRRLGIERAVTIRGYMSHDELAQRLRRFDVFAIPSQQEGLCIAALEALACGCPVVSTRCGGPEEFVLEGRTGTLVQSDPADMAAAIARIVGDRELRAHLAAGAVSLVRERYSAPRVAAIFWRAFAATFAGELASARV